MRARLAVRVQPRANRSEVVGLHGDSIKIRLKAPPIDGAANEELIRFVAESLGVSRSHIELKSGLRGRSKTIAIEGISEEDARSALLALKG